MNCFQSELTRNRKAVCDETISTGVDETYYLFQKRNIASFAFDATSRIIVASIVMKTGKFLNAYQGYPKSLEPTVGHEETDYGPKLPQTFKFGIRSNSPETKEEIQAMVYANDLGVIYKRAGSGDWEVMGLDNGMRLTSGGLAYAPNDATSGAFIVTLHNPDAVVLPYTLRHKTATLVDTDAYLLTIARTDA